MHAPPPADMMEARSMAQPPPEPAPPPLTHPIAVASLDRGAETPFSLSASPEDCARVAEYMKLAEIRELGFDGAISGVRGDGWEASGVLTALVVQSCVVTLAPVLQYVEDTVSRRYMPGVEEFPEGEMIVSRHDEDEGPDPLGAEIDVAALMLESLALAIDPYPRAQGAALETRIFAEPGIKPMTDEDARPFAKLADLKEKLTGEK